ncbi:polysaccharide deacetylase family protein [Roseospirillum parvum]|uniref:DUF2334 domain-containing protein n=1 Tax=Roseospirillum parvum TaxID=83401 RepID=A0A1G7WM99_9PROT|nr:polysaccharide deacetylase family protein [Roseospirillum parvum]SDG73036.1 hypothetical protein SAMN05421742_102253 [Roseospirillum parvum]
MSAPPPPDNPRAGGPIVSIHDVMPHTLERVGHLLGLTAPLGPVDLLVVPGLDWQPPHIATLKGWQQAGHRLAGHGWTHKARHIKRPYHRLHSLLVSRDVAEHLALDADGIIELMNRCHGWFAAHDLAPPDLYVPPAWALGPLPRHRLNETPFQRVEVLAGVIDTTCGHLTPSPVIGFEADTPLRALTLKTLNSLQLNWARITNRPWRLAIHPDDHTLKLAPNLHTTLERARPGATESKGALPP